MSTPRDSKRAEFYGVSGHDQKHGQEFDFDPVWRAVAVISQVPRFFGDAQPLFESDITDPYIGFYVTANGQHFLIPPPVIEGTPSPVTVVINWTKGVKP